MGRSARRGRRPGAIIFDQRVKGREGVMPPGQPRPLSHEGSWLSTTWPNCASSGP